MLGPLDVREGDRRLELGGPRQRTLLAHLVLRANELVPADRLVDGLWGDEPPATARASVQTYVSRLRRALGEGRLEGRSGGYVLHVAAGELDADRFEGLVDRARGTAQADPAAATCLYREALDLWRGLALDDLADQPSLLADRERLDELRASAAEERIRAQLATGAHAEVVPELEDLTARHPLREGLWADLMVALYRSGRQAEALAAFQQVRQTLVDELGIEPSPELQRLHKQILAQDPSLAVPGRPVRGYRVHGELGRGAFGVVHRATQPQVGREVAIKVIRPELANHPNFIRAFEVEAQLVAQLEHPHIVPLYDYWREPSGAFLVMRHLAGGSLRDRMDRGGEVDLVPMIDDIGRALAFAHRRGVVHGDVKAANILFDDEGNAFLSDFGIGYDDAGVAVAGSSSPEGLRGEPLTPRTDVYCLGLVVEQLAGAPPSGSPALTAVLERATTADPQARYPTVEELVAAIRDAVRAAPRWATPIEVRNPFKGLRPFLEPDAGDFFGRDELVARLVERLQEATSDRFLAVVGPSGAGKSSVVRAGLVPALRGGALPGSESWFHLDMVPGADPFAQLEAALRRVARKSPSAPLAEAVASAPRGLAGLLDQALDEAPALLLIDQFEELFTLVDDEDVRGRFIDEVLHAATDPDSTLRVVVTIRADHLDDSLRHPRLAELLQRHTEFAVPLSPLEVAQVVMGPVEQVGGTVEPELVARVTSDFVHEPGALPLLQYTLTELFERKDGSLLARHYDAMGGLAATLTHRADATLDGLDAAARDATRQLFLRLVTISEAGVGTRRRTGLSELRSLVEPARAMDAAVEAFGTARLLTFDRDTETREPTVEVAHEALLMHWARLVAWIDGAREELGVHQRLVRATRDWLDADRDESYLSTGANLEQFQVWRRTAALALTPDEQAFLDVSADAHLRHQREEEARQAHEQLLERRSLRRMRALVVVLTVAALVGAGLSAVALRQRGEARTQARLATARALVAGATEQLDQDPELALFLALEGVELTRADDGTVRRDAEQVLHDAVAVASRIDRVLPGVGGRVAWSPAGDVVAALRGERTGRVELYNPVTGAVRAALEHGSEVYGLAFAPDGRLLATGGADGTLRLWDTESGTATAILEGPDGEVRGPSFSPDGAMVAASWQEAGRALVWDVRSRTRIANIDVDAQSGGTAFSPDGQRLLVMAWTPEAVGVVVDMAAAIAAFAEGRDRLGDAELFRLQGELSILWSPEGAWSPDGRWIASAPGQVWDAETGDPTVTLGTDPLDVAEDVAWSSDGARLVGVYGDGDTVIWDTAETPFTPVLRLPGPSPLGDVAVSPSGEHVVTGGRGLTAARIWDISPLGSVELANAESAPEFANEGFAVSPDGTRVADHLGDGFLRVRDSATMEEIWRVPAHEAFVLDDGFEVLTVPNIEWSADGTLLATGGADQTAVWDADTGARRFTVDLEPFVMTPAFHPDSQHVAVDRSRDVAIFDRDGDEVAVLPRPPEIIVEGMAFSADGRHLVVAQYTWPPDHQFEVVVWDWQEREVVRTLATEAWNIGLAPTGTLMVTADANGVAEVWDWDRGERVRRLVGHAGDVQHAQFNADGSLIATGGFDGTLRVWDVESGRQLLRLGDFDGLTHRVRFDPQGRWVAGIGRIGNVHVIRFFALDLDELVEIARGHVTRPLTEEECLDYLPPESCPAA